MFAREVYNFYVLLLLLRSILASLSKEIEEQTERSLEVEVFPDFVKDCTEEAEGAFLM